jgi:O-antigen ligase
MNRRVAATPWFALVAAALLAVATGGGLQAWNGGLVLLLLGLTVVLHPPRGMAHYGFAVLALLLLGWCLVAAVFPAAGLPAPSWRIELEQGGMIPLPPTVTAQPWVTLDALFMLSAGLIVFVYYCNRPLTPGQMVDVFRCLCLGLGALAAVALGAHAGGWEIPWWQPEKGFGFFPNRNQTGAVLTIGSILGLGLAARDFRRRTAWRYPQALAFLFCLVLQMANGSRAASGLTVLGILAVVALTGLLKPSLRGLLVLVGAILLAGAAFWWSGDTRERWESTLEGQQREENTGPATWGRFPIYQDAVAMISDQPWTGIGLGNFSALSSFYRSGWSGQEERVSHPESDWLWLAAEGGVPALLLAVALLGLALFTIQQRRLGDHGHYAEVWWAAALAAGASVIHSCIDVPVHRMGSMLVLMVVVAALCAPPWEARRDARGGLTLALGGLLVAVWGGVMLAAPRLVPPVGARIEALVAPVPGQAAAVRVARLSEAVGIKPLDWSLYYRRAVAGLGEGDLAGALLDFKRARTLEQQSWQVAADEARMWLGIVPELAAPAYEEAVRRASEQWGRRGDETFDLFVDAAVREPVLWPHVEAGALANPIRAMACFGKLPDARQAGFCESVLADEGLAARLTEGDLARIRQRLAQEPPPALILDPAPPSKE